MGLPISTGSNGENYDFIIVIIDCLTKIVYYKLIKIIINTSELAEILLDIIVWYYSLSDLIVSNKSLLFISKFWLLLYYFFGIKHRFLTAFYPQINGQTKQQNSTMEA